MNLSAHFTLEEFTTSQTAARRGIDNSPAADVLERMKKTAQGLEAVRVRLGCAPITVTSGYRSPALNAAIGGAAQSQHMTGEAADFICPRFGSPAEIAAALVDSGIAYDQLILEFAGKGGGWVHISFSENPRHHALSIDRTGTRPLFK